MKQEKARDWAVGPDEMPLPGVIGWVENRVRRCCWLVMLLKRAFGQVMPESMKSGASGSRRRTDRTFTKGGCRPSFKLPLPDFFGSGIWVEVRDSDTA